MKASLFLYSGSDDCANKQVAFDVPDTVTRGEVVLEVVDGVSRTLANGTLPQC